VLVVAAGCILLLSAIGAWVDVSSDLVFLVFVPLNMMLLLCARCVIRMTGGPLPFVDIVKAKATFRDLPTSIGPGHDVEWVNWLNEFERLRSPETAEYVDFFAAVWRRRIATGVQETPDAMPRLEAMEAAFTRRLREQGVDVSRLYNERGS
jgi:hypothetical protein